MKTIIHSLLTLLIIISISGCTSKQEDQNEVIPTEIVDLGALVTEDLPEQVMSNKLLTEMDFARNNSFFRCR